MEFDKPIIKGAFMDLSQVTAMNSGLSPAVQGTNNASHHHHHHKSISDQVNQMNSAIDDAVKAGTMTSDQATSLKKELSDVTQILSQSAQTSNTSNATSQSGPTGQISQLSDADRKKVFSELHDVRKQLWAANSPQASNAVSGSSTNSDAVTKLFSQIDTDNSGTIDQAEFTQFLAQIGANALGYSQNGNVGSANSGSIFSALA
jgi:septal ring factor EnvC (AmiA/AmiB activator)